MAVQDTYSLWQDYRKSGDQELRDRLILTYAPLVKFVADGSLSVEIGWRGTWDRIAEAVRALSGRRVSGKAVLDVRPLAPVIATSRGALGRGQR